MKKTVAWTTAELKALDKISQIEFGKNWAELTNEQREDFYDTAVKIMWFYI